MVGSDNSVYVGLKEASKLTGLTVRQIRYAVDQGHIRGMVNPKTGYRYPLKADLSKITLVPVEASND